MAFGLHAGDDQTVLVVDWGGGTLDVTVLELVDGVFLEHASKGVQRLGGLDFDALVIEHLAGEIRGSYGWTEADRAALRLEVERAKINLSRGDEVTVALPGGDSPAPHPGGVRGLGGAAGAAGLRPGAALPDRSRAVPPRAWTTSSSSVAPA